MKVSEVGVVNKVKIQDVRICRECKYVDLSARHHPHPRCDNSSTPYDDYILGIKHCYIINAKGDCKFYEKE